MTGANALERSELGKLQIYTGSGRGKSSTAIGLALRMMGAGGRVWLYAFMKNLTAAEYQALALLVPAIKLRCSDDNTRQPLFYAQNADQQAKSRQRYRALWQELLYGLREEPTPHLLILDEISYVIDEQMIPLSELLLLIKFCRQKKIELILTGRDMPKPILKQADLISEILERKHPLQQQIPARHGIEY